MRLFATTSIALAMGLAGTPAMAQETLAAAGIITNRSCTAPVGQPCAVGSAALTRQYYGGVGGGFSASLSNMNGTGASGAQAVEFGSDYLPLIRVGGQAGATTRTGSSALALRSYTYTGSRAINLVLNGLLDFTTSGDIAGGDYANDGQLFAGIRIMPLSVLNGLDPSRTAESIVNDFSLVGDCANGALAASDYDSGGFAPGSYTATLSLSTLCGGGAIVLNPGDRFVVSMLVQSITNRGGLLDAMHTFRAVYDGANTTFVDSGQSVGAGYLSANITSAIPEPGTWATMLLGFLLTGLGLRARRNRPLAVPAT